MVRRWGSVAVAIVAVAILVAPAATVAAASPAAHGWWWRLQSGVGPHLTPPGVPEGGLWVTADPSGDQAVAALRSDGAARELRLHVAEVTGTPTVVACPASSAWEAADGGAWDARPDAACDDVLVAATIADDMLTVPLNEFGGGDVNIVLVPDATASGYFSISFEPPGDDTFVVGTPAEGDGVGAPAATPPATTRSASVPVPTVAPRPQPVTYEPPPSSFATPIFEPPPTVAGSRDADARTTGLDAPRSRDGTREPLAIVALLIVTAAWVYRGRAALRGAAAHPLANVAFRRAEE